MTVLNFCLIFIRNASVFLCFLQVLVVMDGENWKNVLSDGKPSSLHLLTPTSLTVNFDKCVITNDPRFPMLKIAGHLPSVAIAISGKYPSYVCL